MTRRGLAVRSAVVLVAVLASHHLSQRLATRDPIAEVLLGRAGTTLPLAAAVLALRLGLMVGLPVVGAIALAGAAVRRMQREKETKKEERT